MPWYEHKNPVLTAVFASLLVLLAVLVALFIRVARRMFLARRPLPSPQPGTRWLPWTAQLASALWLIVLVALGTVLVLFGSDDAMPPSSAWDKYLVVMNFVTALAVGLSVWAVFSAIRICGRTDLRHTTRVKYSLVAVAGVILSWFSIHWHLLGPVRI